VDFRCNYNGLIFSARDLDRPIVGASPIFADHARRYLDSIADRTGTTVGAKVRELMRVQLSSGRCTIDRLAHQVGWDRRTLQRKLASEQVTFNETLDAVRAELAVQLLQNRTASLASTADMLGFSGDSAFSRWFLGHFGSRPSDWRKQLDTPQVA
jgi:AraC-like DNA-binding protein